MSIPPPPRGPAPPLTPATTDTGTWTVVANRGSLGSLCTEGANRKVALVNGTF